MTAQRAGQSAESAQPMRLLEAQAITPDCREGRGTDGAWDEAARRLREIYDAQVEHDPDLTLSLTIYRGDHRDAVAGGAREARQQDAADLAGPPSGHGPTESGYRGIAGHCHDIDGNLWHAPGECAGAVVNCNGDCCALVSTSPGERSTP